MVTLSERTERAKSTIKTAVSPEAAALQASGEATAPLGTSNNPSSAIFTVANVITFCRFLLTFAFLVIFIQKDPNTRGLAVTFYVVAAITDFLDGQVARRTQTVSWLGKVMDPIMDRVLLFTGVIGLMIIGELPVWVTLVIIVRDIILFLGAMRLKRYQQRPMDVILVGKAATALLMTGFADMLLATPMVQGLGLVDVSWLPGFNHEPCALGIFFVYAGMICSIIAACIYFRNGFAIRDAYRRQHAAQNAE